MLFCTIDLTAQTYLNYDIVNTVLLRPNIGIEKKDSLRSYGGRILFRSWDLGQVCDRGAVPTFYNAIGTNMFYRKNSLKKTNLYFETLLDSRVFYDKNYTSCFEGLNFSGRRTGLTVKLGGKIGLKGNYKKNTFVDFAFGFGVGLNTFWDKVEKAYPSYYIPGKDDEAILQDAKRFFGLSNGKAAFAFLPYLQVNMNHRLRKKN